MVQLGLGAVGWTFADEVMDVGAMVAISALVGFHPLLLPTFVLELVPVVDVLPTWTACVALVLSLRRKQRFGPRPGPPRGPVIDV
jgi:hypothetical protein